MKSFFNNENITNKMKAAKDGLIKVKDSAKVGASIMKDKTLDASHKLKNKVTEYKNTNSKYKMDNDEFDPYEAENNINLTNPTSKKTNS